MPICTDTTPSERGARKERRSIHGDFNSYNNLYPDPSA
jgi:hypothetical protein